MIVHLDTARLDPECAFDLRTAQLHRHIRAFDLRTAGLTELERAHDLRAASTLLERVTAPLERVSV